MRSTDPARLGAAALAAVLATGALSARADEPREDILLEGVLVSPLEKPERVGPSLGGGVSLDVMPDHDEVLLLDAGAFAAFAPAGLSDAAEQRDLYDLRFDVGVRLPAAEVLMPFFAAGLDLLATTIRVDDQVARGVTLAGNLRAGFASYLGQRFLLRLTATFLAGILPGTGDALQAIVLTAGLGVGRAGPPPYEPPPPPPPPPPVYPPPYVPPTTPPSPVYTPGGTLPGEAAAAASAAVQCPASSLALESVEDERIGCPGASTGAGASCDGGTLLYRSYRVTGCGRRAEIQCYESPGVAALSCLAAPQDTD